MTKWEYCAVVGISSKGGRLLEPYHPAIWSFTPRGYEVVQITGQEAAEVAKIIAHLGEEGWEMVACANAGETGLSGSEAHILYFKRPKSQS